MPVRSGLTAADRLALVALARGTIAERLGLALPEPPRTAAFDTLAGAFVTVYIEQQLRGCIGLTNASQPLAAAVMHCAVAAAFEDPRFAPIARDEIAALAVEISVLSPLERIDDALALEIGRHGLVIAHGWRRGLLLPQVAVEHGWSVLEFLQYTCIKAGLPADAWRQGAQLFRFEAEVFGEVER